jgi:undecaprenyl-diphosphatase
MPPTYEEPVSFASATFLGALQGLAEFLPVSSSGHLALAQHFMGLEKLPLFFDLMLHVGTLAAVVWHYRRDLFGASTQPTDAIPNLRDRASFAKLCVWLALALAPAVLAKLAFEETEDGKPQTWRSQVGDMREHSSERPFLVLSFLASTSLVLLAASRVSPGTIGVSQTTWRHALFIGIAQALSALCPGLSRSGMTISAALLLGFSAVWAVNFSLLLSIPTILAASIWEARRLTFDWVSANWLPTAWATVVAAIVGYASIQLLARSVMRRQWGLFAVYLWLVILVVGPIAWFRPHS